ncbi:MAG: DNA polymerase III subunit beta [bacterium]|jgi:DNA polymerase-3 subunit beta|nr:DNA polymerase III subunit beta [candidate division KSB1 bacterium]MDH7561200.1 DNA polymerase III subunit beta [bacterium]
MEYSISRTDLHKALQKVATVVPSKTTLPILSNILMKVEGSLLTLTATDLEISVTTSIAAETIEPGATTVSARIFSDIVKELPDVGLRITCDQNHKITITTDRGTYVLSGQPAEDYPTVTAEEYENQFSIGADVFERLIGKSTFAVSTDALRPALSGVYFEVFPSELRLVATDGHRLSKVVYRRSSLSSGESSAIVPPKALQAAQKSLEEGIAQVKVSIARSHITFRSDATEVCAKLIDQQYPNYERVIPTNNDRIMIIDRSELISALRRMAIFSSTMTHLVRFDIERNLLTISSEDIEVGGEGRESLAIEYVGEPLRIGYNANYLIEILRHINTQLARFELRDPVSAALIRPTEQSENEEFLALVMPIRVTEE